MAFLDSRTRTAAVEEAAKAEREIKAGKKPDL